MKKLSLLVLMMISALMGCDDKYRVLMVAHEENFDSLYRSGMTPGEYKISINSQGESTTYGRTEEYNEKVKIVKKGDFLYSFTAPNKAVYNFRLHKPVTGTEVMLATMTKEDNPRFNLPANFTIPFTIQGEDHFCAFNLESFYKDFLFGEDVGKTSSDNGIFLSYAKKFFNAFHWFIDAGDYLSTEEKYCVKRTKEFKTYLNVKNKCQYTTVEIANIFKDSSNIDSIGSGWHKIKAGEVAQFKYDKVNPEKYYNIFKASGSSRLTYFTSDDYESVFLPKKGNFNYNENRRQPIPSFYGYNPYKIFKFYKVPSRILHKRFNNNGDMVMSLYLDCYFE